MEGSIKELMLFTLLFMALGYVTAKKGDPFIPIMSARLERCTSYCHPKYCNVTTVCRPLNRTSKFVSMDIYVHPGLKLEAPMKLQVLSFKKFGTVYRPSMINIRTELCKELASMTHPFFSLMKDLSVSGNLLDPCPITGHRHTKPRITNVYDYVSPLLPIVTDGQWRMDAIISVERNGSDVVVMSWNDYYEVKVLTAEQF